MNSAFTPSANVLSAANKARGMLYFIKKVIYVPDEGDLRTSIKCVGESTSRIRHPSKLSLPQKGHIPPRKNTTGSNEVSERSYEDRLKLQATQITIPRKRRIGNDSVLTHKIIYKQIDLEASQLFNFSRTKKVIIKTSSTNRENP